MNLQLLGEWEFHPDMDMYVRNGAFMVRLFTFNVT